LFVYLYLVEEEKKEKRRIWECCIFSRWEKKEMEKAAGCFDHAIVREGLVWRRRLRRSFLVSGCVGQMACRFSFVLFFFLMGR